MGPHQLLILATAPPSPVPEPAGTSGGGAAWVGAVIASTVVAAVVSGLVAFVLAWRSHRLDERARVRAAFADAFRACAEYKEMPYAVRRRRADQPGDERVRLSEQLRDIQARLSYYQAWTASECDGVGAAYDTLVTAVRSRAGGAMREAWKGPALDNDPGMNIPPEIIDLRALAEPERAFLAAAANHTKRAGSLLRLRHTCDTPTATTPTAVEPTAG